MIRLALVIAVAGCGRIAFAPLDDAAVATDTATVDGDLFDPELCPATYTLVLVATNSRYRLNDTSMNWRAAADDCANDSTLPGIHTHLAVFGVDAEQQQIEQLITDRWVGYSDLLTEGTFLAVTQEPLGAHLGPAGPGWYPAEPNGGTTENCLHTKIEGGLNDELCTSDRESICECDGNANDPTRY